MIVMTLNIRGLGGCGTKAGYLRLIIAREDVEVMNLQETKAKSFSDARCFSL